MWLIGFVLGLLISRCIYLEYVRHVVGKTLRSESAYQDGINDMADEIYDITKKLNFNESSTLEEFLGSYVEYFTSTQKLLESRTNGRYTINDNK